MVLGFHLEMEFCFITSVDLSFSVCPFPPVFERQVQVISPEDGLGDCIRVPSGSRASMKRACVHARQHEAYTCAHAWGWVEGFHFKELVQGL